MYLKKSILIILCAFFALSCSLNYGIEEQFEDFVPEFTFINAKFQSYENNRLTRILQAERLEQYKSDGSSFAKKASFQTFDKQGKLDTQGQCDFLSADNTENKYSLFDNVVIDIYAQELSVFANALYFDSNNEQLVSKNDDTISIKRKNTTITGSGFSASGVSQSFSFKSSVSGSIQEEEKQEQIDSESSSE